ncbi:MAG: dTMP kinase [Vulcanimicrobiota bacterium]
MKGYFISFEGLEGAGKSTQAKILNERLIKEGFPCLLTSEPGGTPLGNEIRQILANNDFKDMSSLTELYLFAASRAQHVSQVIRPNIEEGSIVLCDRFVDATIAYQSYGRGLPENLVRETCSSASWNVRPNLTIYLDIEPSRGLTRVSKRIQELEIPAHRIEKEQLEFFQKVREGYLSIARDEPNRVKMLHADTPVPELASKIYNLVSKELKKIKFKKMLGRDLSFHIPTNE